MSEVEIQTPINGISIYKNNHCSEKPSIYTLKHSKNFSLKKTNYVVKNSKDTEVFKFEINNFTGKNIINDLRDNSQYQYKIKTTLLEDKLIFYEGEEEDKSEEIELKIKRKNSLFGNLTYEIKIFNKIIDKEDILLVSYDNLKSSYKILYGNEEDSPVICKFKTANAVTMDFEIEIAPTIDEIFILALCLDITRITRRLFVNV